MSVSLGYGMTVPKSSVQSVIFNKKYYTEEQARRWLHSHSFRTNFTRSSSTKPSPHITENFIRYRQFDPPMGGRYITKIISRGVELIILI
jgi:hypothetical protein